MAVNFGTYEGHRILSDAATKLADRVQKGYQFKKQNELDERKRRDYAERMRHQNLLTDAQTRHEGERQLKTEQEWRKIQTMTPAEYANVRSITGERDTLLDPRVRNLDATTSNIQSQERARDEELKRDIESRTRARDEEERYNIESQTRSRDEEMRDRTIAETGDIHSRTRARDEETRDRIIAETGDVQSRTRAREEEERDRTIAQTGNIQSQQRERDELLGPRIDQTIATTGDIRSRTDERDTLLGPRRDQVVATTEGIQSRTEGQDISNNVTSHNFGRQQIDEARHDQIKDISNQYYKEMSQKLEDFDLYDEELGELRGEAVPMLLQAIENTYPQDIMSLDPDGKLSLQDYTSVGDNLHKLYNQEIVSRMTNELSKAGLDRNQIEVLIQNAEMKNPQIKGAFDSFYREGLGKEPKSPTTGLGPLEEALYGVDSVENQFSKVTEAINSMTDLDVQEDLTIEQDDFGTIKVIDDDGMFNPNDEYVVSFGDRGRPYIKYKGENVYLDSQEIYDAFD